MLQTQGDEDGEVKSWLMDEQVVENNTFDAGPVENPL